MENQINISEIPSINKLVKDYLNKESFVRSFYHQDFNYQNLINQSKEKINNYLHRETLVYELSEQLSKIHLSDKQKLNLEKLSLKNTVTITTGHQLNLMSGPLFFIYKILHVIKLCDFMNKNQKEIYFVPMFWMATEDHDFEEINHFYFNNKKIEWKDQFKDYVGEIPATSLEDVLHPFHEKLKYFPKGRQLREIIENSYFTSENLAEATQKFVHRLFKDYGLLFIDGNSRNLKKLFVPFIKDDIKYQKSFHEISKTINLLKDNYKIQVNPRNINFFYRDNQERKRIEPVGNKYKIVDTKKTFSSDEIVKELDLFPEKFSPNALLRPVYQEVILPNVAYIGGNAEIAYWLELKKYFDEQNLIYPILIPRNSVLLLNSIQEKKMQKLDWKGINIFESKKKIIDSLVNQLSTNKFDFKKYENQLKNIFNDLIHESINTDSTWRDMILAQQKMQLNGLNKINKRFHKAERLKYNEYISNFEKLYMEIFPYNQWQERIVNFSEYYANMGTDFFDLIYSNINEFESVISIVNIDK